MQGLRIVGKIISKVAALLLTLLLIFNLYTIVMRQIFGQKQPSVFGFSVAVVVSGSMEPAISVDDMIIIHKQKSYELHDIVMYESGQSMVTHRIVEMEDGVYITRGDSNNTDDPPVSEERIAGKVICIIPGAGKVISFIQSPLGMCILVLLAAAVLLPDLRHNTKKESKAEESSG